MDFMMNDPNRLFMKNELNRQIKHLHRLHDQPLLNERLDTLNLDVLSSILDNAEKCFTDENNPYLEYHITSMDKRMEHAVIYSFFCYLFDDVVLYSFLEKNLKHSLYLPGNEPFFIPSVAYHYFFASLRVALRNEWVEIHDIWLSWNIQHTFFEMLYMIYANGVEMEFVELRNPNSSGKEPTSDYNEVQKMIYSYFHKMANHETNNFYGSDEILNFPTQIFTEVGKLLPFLPEEKDIKVATYRFVQEFLVSYFEAEEEYAVFLSQLDRFPSSLVNALRQDFETFEGEKMVIHESHLPLSTVSTYPEQIEKEIFRLFSDDLYGDKGTRTLMIPKVVFEEIYEQYCKDDQRSLSLLVMTVLLKFKNGSFRSLSFFWS